MIPRETGRSRRTGLRVPVDFQVRCEYNGNGRPTVMAKAVNMSTGGLFITTSEPIELKAKLVLEFLMPATMNSIQVQGESVWSCPCSSQEKQLQGTGIKFVNLDEPHFRLIRDYALSNWYVNDLVKGEELFN